MTLEAAIASGKPYRRESESITWYVPNFARAHTLEEQEATDWVLLYSEKDQLVTLINRFLNGEPVQSLDPTVQALLERLASLAH